jgi:hypothetical protein
MLGGQGAENRRSQLRVFLSSGRRTMEPPLLSSRYSVGQEVVCGGLGGRSSHQGPSIF